jgi:dienelactone hydrolase
MEGVAGNMKTTLSGFLAVLLVGLASTLAAEDVLIPTTEGGKPLMLPGTLHTPEGDGPFPAMVMLVGCGGYAGGGPNADHQTMWARRLVGWGYVVLQVESYIVRPGFTCGYDLSVTISHDAFSAQSYLSRLPTVDPGRIFVIGWSMGGAAALRNADRFSRQAGVSPFRAAVAFYPLAYPVRRPDTPLLIVTGRKDEICKAEAAEMLKAQHEGRPGEPEFSVTIYPNAYHAFDLEGIDLQMNGQHFRYDPEAAADAILRTREFLSRYGGAF